MSRPGVFYLISVSLPFLQVSSLAEADDFSLAFQQAVERSNLRRDICVVLGHVGGTRLQRSVHQLWLWTNLCGNLSASSH